MKLNKKGFTIVELVIVIAVIAILAAVLIPTFSTVIANANRSAALQEAKVAMDVVSMENDAKLSGNFYIYTKEYGFTYAADPDANGKTGIVKTKPDKYAKGADNKQKEIKDVYKENVGSGKDIAEANAQYFANSLTAANNLAGTGTFTDADITSGKLVVNNDISTKVIVVGTKNAD